MDLLFLIWGVYLIFLKEAGIGWLLLFWLVASIVPAATARETPHALRIENGLPVYLILISVGLADFYRRNFLKSSGKIIIGLFSFLYLVNILFYFHNYYIHYSWRFSGEWQFGYREAIKFIQPIKNNYSQIIMSDTIGRPYMYTLFYEKTDPHLFWQKSEASFDAAGFYNVYGFDKYKYVRGSVKDFSQKTLYILDPQNAPANARILKKINLLNNEPKLVIFDLP